MGAKSATCRRYFLAVDGEETRSPIPHGIGLRRDKAIERKTEPIALRSLKPV
jgi:hypothetical protein